MKETSTIETKRLSIVPFSEEHLTPRYVSWLNDPQVVRFSEQRHRHHTLESCREYWQSFRDTPNFFWAMMIKGEEPRHIGNMNAYVDIANSVTDVGILIGERDVWGCGYGLEAWSAVCNFLLDRLCTRKVTGGTLTVNTAMVKIMQRAGMVEDGRRIRQCIFEGKEVDVIHSALFRHLWKGSYE